MLPRSILAIAWLGTSTVALAQLAPIHMAREVNVFVPIKGRELLQTINGKTVGADGLNYVVAQHQWAPILIEPGSVAQDPPAGRRYMFYSNRPEEVVDTDPPADSALCNKSTCLADSLVPKVFLRDQVTGLGQVFSWHANSSTSNLYHGIVLRNPNSYAIHVASNAWATMDRSVGDNADDNNAAWQRYLHAPAFDETLQPDQQVLLFRHSAPANGGAFGIVAEIEITKQSDLVTPATAWMVDLAWQNDSAAGLPDIRDYSAVSMADGGGWERGVGNRYETYLTLNSKIDPISQSPQVYQLGSKHCNKGGYLEDDGTGIAMRSPDSGTYVAAMYGRATTVQWPLVNRGTVPVRMRVAIGNACSPTDGAVGVTVRYSSGRVVSVDNLVGTSSAGSYVDVLEADVPPGESWDVRFQLFPAAPRIFPITVGAYIVQ
ncbi:hypothetical protein [Dyella koreensis]|uniref:DUF946 domain-containing protein n=1 Tax=Dyella koreensis TaxID=311235 RepID=A0ABW8JZQ2_9GAMM